MIIKDLEEYMIPCLNKKLFGTDCLGCGAQRATAFLFEGDFIAAFKMFPAIYTVIILAGFLLIDFFIKFKYSETIKIVLMVLNLTIILSSYLIKHVL